MFVLTDSDPLITCSFTSGARHAAGDQHSACRSPGLQPVVKLQLHSAGDASPLHPTALKNPRWGPRPLTALLLPQIFPMYSRYSRSSRLSAGFTPRTVRRGVGRRVASPPSVRRRTFTTARVQLSR